MKPRNFKLGIIGAGRIFGKHISALRHPKNSKFSIAGVAEISSDQVRIRSNEYDLKYVSDLSEILSDSTIQIVSVLTESGKHFDHAMRCIEAGKHVIVEKPVTLRLDHAKLLSEAARRLGLNVYVVKQNRFNAAFQKLSAAVKNNALGQIVGGNIRVRWCRDQHYYDQATWRGTWALDGGALTNQAIHHLDLMCTLMGKPKSVFALSKTQLVNIEVEDQIVGVIEFENGALVSLEVTTAIRPRNIEASISLYGSGGVIEIAGQSVNELRFFLTECKDQPSVISTNENNLTNDVYGDGHITMYNEVYKHLSGLPNEATLIVDAMPSLKLLHSIYSSVELGRMVYFDEDLHSKRLGLQ